MCYFIRLFIGSLLLFCPFQISAVTREDPQIILKNVTDQMLSALKKERGVIQSNPKRLTTIIEKILVPHLDLHNMSRWVMGRNSWIQATPTQRDNFAREFKILLIKTYSSSLASYHDQAINYLPLREDWRQKQRVQVATVVSSEGAKDIAITYRLTYASGRWLLYDINVEGVSLLEGFRAQFMSDIQNIGLPAVIEKIKAHNQDRVNA